ncbi:unnamed protein product [Gordionus sp. m RMFG-2023]
MKKVYNFDYLFFLGLKIISAQDQCKLTQEGSVILYGQTISISSKYPYGAINIASVSKCKGIFTVSIGQNHPIYIQSINSKPVLITNLHIGNFGLGAGPNQLQFNVLKIKKLFAMLDFEIGIDNRNQDTVSINVKMEGRNRGKSDQSEKRRKERDREEKNGEMRKEREEREERRDIDRSHDGRHGGRHSRGGHNSTLGDRVHGASHDGHHRVGSDHRQREGRRHDHDGFVA